MGGVRPTPFSNSADLLAVSTFQFSLFLKRTAALPPSTLLEKKNKNNTRDAAVSTLTTRNAILIDFQSYFLAQTIYIVIISTSLICPLCFCPRVH